MSWIDSSEYNPTDICSICLNAYGTTEGIYKTKCNHIFHNNCLDEYCDEMMGEIRCPLCRGDVGKLCHDVYAFKERVLGNSDGKSLFNGNKKILNIYNARQGGMRYKIVKRKTKKQSKRKTRKTRKTKKQSKRKIKYPSLQFQELNF